MAPFLNDGIITPRALLDWENTCDDFFVAAKEPVPEDKKVLKVTVGLQNSCICDYIRNNWTCLHALTFTEFMSELHETFLPANWDKDTLQKIVATRMTLNQSFYDFCTDIVTLNRLLAGSPLYLDRKSVV